ncbi:hypothetical protein C8Q73DRAFT_699132 [Cubamyces lactineus]|nr:hypothetical protein C8Q73DRAFT_699132 [Cubamyces lactineus]
MISSFGALRALLVAAALCSPALSLPRLPALKAKRSLHDYVDNLVYLDANKSSLYCAVEANRETYGAYLDNHWGGLVMKSSSSQGSTSQITVEGVSVSVSSNHGTIGFMQEDIEIDYYTTSQWPSSWPAIGSSAGVGAARIGIDITDSKSVMNQYIASKWSNILDNWYYDLFVFYDWMNATSQSVEIDFAGIITTGSTLDWTSVFDISASQVSQYGLPDLSSIKNQPYIYYRPDGTFYIDNCLWANGKQVTISSNVPKTSSDSVVVDISLTERFSLFPHDVVKAIYGSLSGNMYYAHSTYGYYQIPCNSQVSFWFTIDGVKYTVNQDALMAPNPWGDQCIGTIFSSGQSPSYSSQWDIVFGFQFLSSFYYRSGISHSTNQPYAKLLPLPSPSQGWYGSSSGSWSWSSSGGSSIQYSDGASYGGSTATYSAGSSGSTYGYSGSNSNQNQNSNSGSSYQGGYNGGYNGNQGYQSSASSTTYQASSTYYSGSGSNSGNSWGNNDNYNGNSGSYSSSNGNYNGNNGGYNGNNGGYSTDKSYQSTTYGGSSWGNNNNSGNGNYGGNTYTPSTSTTFTTTTITHIGTTTVAYGASATGSYGYSGSGSNGYSGSGSDNGYSGSGSGSNGYSGSGYSGSGYDSENLAVAGNAAETDDQGNDLNLPHGSIVDKLKHCLPAIIVVVALAGLGLVIGLITCLVRRRRGNDGSARGSAYTTVHFKDVHEPVNAPLYGAEDGSSRYSDPYKDKE